MQVNRYLFILPVLLTLMMCTDKTEDPKVGNLNIHFKLSYDGKPLEMFKNVTYPDTSDSLFFSRISFYMSDLYISNPVVVAGLKEIDYLDLTPSHTGIKAKDGFLYTINNIPVGDYSTLGFHIGVPKADNAKTPNDFSGSSVLSKIAEYWSAWKSYIFFRPEGKIALINSTIPNQNFALHLGGDSSNVPVVLNKSIKIIDQGTSDVDIDIDMYKFFKSKTLHNIQANRQIHSPEQEPIVVKLAENLSEAIK